ncbi:unknown [Anaerotruncus sp. CAG:390]|nr:unknown [Anaerotruncus sp. CAG:390]
MIAKECGIGKADTVDKAINTLIGKGLLTKRHQMRFDGGNASNMYTLSEIGDAVIRHEGC